MPRERQEEAEKFLSDNAFMTPLWMVDEEILRRIEAVGVLDRIRNAQQSVLTNLLNSARFSRLVEQETLDGSRAYALTEFLASVRKGVWKELDAPSVKIDAYRRGLQRSYLTLANNKLNPPIAAVAAAVPGGQPAPGGRGGRGGASTSGDEKPMYRAELRTLSASITAALAKSTDHIMRRGRTWKPPRTRSPRCSIRSSFPRRPPLPPLPPDEAASSAKGAAGVFL